MLSMTRHLLIHIFLLLLFISCQSQIAVKFDEVIPADDELDNTFNIENIIGDPFNPLASMVVNKTNTLIDLPSIFTETSNPEYNLARLGSLYYYYDTDASAIFSFDEANQELRVVSSEKKGTGPLFVSGEVTSRTINHHLYGDSGNLYLLTFSRDIDWGANTQQTQLRIYLVDPSTGNRQLLRQQFEDLASASALFPTVVNFEVYGNNAFIMTRIVDDSLGNGWFYRVDLSSNHPLELLRTVDPDKHYLGFTRGAASGKFYLLSIKPNLVSWTLKVSGTDMTLDTLGADGVTLESSSLISASGNPIAAPGIEYDNLYIGRMQLTSDESVLYFPSTHVPNDQVDFSSYLYPRAISKITLATMESSFITTTEGGKALALSEDESALYFFDTSFRRIQRYSLVDSSSQYFSQEFSRGVSDAGMDKIIWQTTIIDGSFLVGDAAGQIFQGNQVTGNMSLVGEVDKGSVWSLQNKRSILSRDQSTIYYVCERDSLGICSAQISPIVVDLGYISGGASSLGTGPSFGGDYNNIILAQGCAENQLFYYDAGRILELNTATGNRTMISGDGVGSGSDLPTSSIPSAQTNITCSHLYLSDYNNFWSIDLKTGARQVLFTATSNPHINLQSSISHFVVLDGSSKMYFVDYNEFWNEIIVSYDFDSGVLERLPLFAYSPITLGVDLGAIQYDPISGLIYFLGSKNSAGAITVLDPVSGILYLLYYDPNATAGGGGC